MVLMSYDIDMSIIISNKYTINTIYVMAVLLKSDMILQPICQKYIWEGKKMGQYNIRVCTPQSPV